MGKNCFSLKLEFFLLIISDDEYLFTKEEATAMDRSIQFKNGNLNML
jgi:hypothetical protein